MLTINLNLPTLPTQDQKDAMDGANTPDSTNVFVTANDLTPQVNSDWNAVSGVEEILNKPTIPDASLLVPYTGANADVNLGEFGIQLGNLEFDNTPTNVPTGAGSLVWNDTDGTLDLKLKGGNVTLQVGQEQVARVVNKTATNITLLEANYQAVRITGAQGQRLKVDLALATTDVLSAETIGLVTETIANNQEGFITTSGLIRGINTTGSLQSETWADGDILYLSGVTAGRITNIKPLSPLHLITIGYVVHSHITQGTIYVKVDNGYELDELHDVLITTPADNNLLAYESSTSLWKNKSASTLGLVETSNTALTDTRIRKVSVQSNTDASTTSTIAETVLKTLLIPTLGANTTLKIMAQCGKVGTASNAVFKMYYNTTADLSGSPVQIALSNFIAASLFAPFNRDITNKNSVTDNSVFPATASSATEALSSVARTNINVNLSGKYIVITGKAGVVGDSVRVDNARLLIEE
jgi:hypothetical protein